LIDLEQNIYFTHSSIETDQLWMKRANQEWACQDFCLYLECAGTFAFQLVLTPLNITQQNKMTKYFVCNMFLTINIHVPKICWFIL